ncbi:uncharacterized protein LOC131291171 [Anopheles ziemanni]|uniref:uncharacterized protein LOC131269656 n=1 Tax=Anopheles coustani TaxID=139045 RepID=UPI00265AA7EF|nr:uncharacterized protein LOC131269656 [Anopheles coustani]XP_058176345.1 uncharacterized protein LOC131291171 [Anopheles ziemanni]
MDKNETPWKLSMLEMLNKHKSVELMPSEKNPANCDLEASVMELPPTPLVKTLGYGTGVQVYVVKRNLTTEERSPWAIKMLSARDPSNRAMFDKRLSEEADIVENLKHPNIVGFRGYDTIGVGVSFLALEYCNSSLGDILEKRYAKNAGPLEADKAKRMAIDVLSGLVYLHEDAHILHGDLKSFNILINKDFENAKICDFGVSVPLNNKGYLDRVKAPNARYIGTTLWSAPEVFKNDPALISVKADIFAFGLTIYETLTLTPPHTFAGIMDEVITHPASVAKRRLDMSADGEADDEEGAESDEDFPEGDSNDYGEDEDIELAEEPCKVVLSDDDEEPLQKKIKTAGVESIPATVPAVSTSSNVDEEPMLKKLNTTGVDSIAVTGVISLDSTSNKGDEAKKLETTSEETIAATDGVVSLDTTSSNAEETCAEPVLKKLETTSEETIAASGSVVSPETTSSNADDGNPTTLIPILDSNGEELIPEKKAPAVEIICISSDESDDEDSDEDLDEDFDEDLDEAEYETLEVGSDGYDEFPQEEADYEEDEDYEDGQYLNYAVLGTRPPIPSHIDIGEEHLPLVELFHICTEVLPADRPTARQLLDALNKTTLAQGKTDIDTQPCHVVETPSVGGTETQPSENETAN